jgi:hypothetical protein
VYFVVCIYIVSGSYRRVSAHTGFCVQHRCCSSIRGRSRFYGIKAAKLNGLAASLNARSPFFTVRVPRYAAQPDGAVFACASILRVDVLIRVAQIAQPIVASIAVDVVNYT